MRSKRSNFPNPFVHLKNNNPFEPRKTSKFGNNYSSKRIYLIPNCNREFGKEINVSENLTINNEELFNKRKTLEIPHEKKVKKLKKEKEVFNHKLIAIHKKKKSISDLIPKKLNNSSNNCCSNKNITGHLNKDIKIKNKIQSQKNIFYPNKSIKKIEDIIKNDENANPNIIINNKSKMTKYNNNKKEENEQKKIKTNDINYTDKILEIQKNTNPQNVDEYFDDICNELSKYEEKYLVNPDYMSKQSDINFRMRAILIDWLIEVHLKYKLLPQTMYITVNLIDRFLEKNEINRSKLQLVGITAMFISTKYEEIYPPDLKEFVYITDGAYVKSDVLKMENKILSSLEFDITFPTQWTLLETFKRKLDLDEKTFKLAWFLMELCLINSKSLKFKMSHIAAAAILIASKTMKVYRENWFEKNLGIQEKDLDECCKEIYDFHFYNSNHSLKAIRRKFSLVKFDEVGKISLAK